MEKESANTMENSGLENKENKKVDGGRQNGGELPACCRPSDGKANGGSAFGKGILFGLIPHAGCIAFVLASIFGAAFFSSMFKPLLMNRYFFYILILASFVFASFSAVWYLNSNRLLSLNGIRKTWKYLSILYGSTIGINLVFFLFVFPMLANVNFSSNSNPIATTSSIAAVNSSIGGPQKNLEFSGPSGLSFMKLKVDIPCSGHAKLISDELYAIDGVKSVKFNFPDIFEVSYDSSLVSKSQILGIDVLKEFVPTVVS